MEIVNGNLIDGKAIAENILESLKRQIIDINASLNRKICLLGIICTENSSCKSYIRSQQILAERLGIDYRCYQVEPYQYALDNAVTMANRDDAIDGVIVYRPFPKTLDVFDSLRLLDKSKDVEGVCPDNIFGMFFRQEGTIFPPTAKAVLCILDSVGVDLYGKEIVVIGEGAVVGRPLSVMLLQRKATVTVCHLPTYERGNLREHVEKAEVIVSAVGKAHLIKGDWISEGSIVIDIGVNVVDNKIVGDVEFEEAVTKASLITPVPGGVGPVTTAMLIENLILLVSQRLTRR